MEDVVERRVRLTDGALGRAHVLQSVLRHKSVHARRDLSRGNRSRCSGARRRDLWRALLEKPVSRRERLGDCGTVSALGVQPHERRARFGPHAFSQLTLGALRRHLGRAAVNELLGIVRVSVAWSFSGLRLLTSLARWNVAGARAAAVVRPTSQFLSTHTPGAAP